MKAIGKRSIASVLAMLLHAVRIIVWIALVGLTIAVLIMPFVPDLINWAMQFDDIDIDADATVTAGDYLEVLAHFISFAVVLHVIDRLLEILKTLRLGSPFVMENADRFRSVGYALILGEGAKIALGILDSAFDARIDQGLEMTNIIAIAAVFVLAEVFKEGARMKEEQELTV